MERIEAVKLHALKCLCIKDLDPVLLQIKWHNVVVEVGSYRLDFVYLYISSLVYPYILRLAHRLHPAQFSNICALVPVEILPKLCEIFVGVSKI